MTVVGNLLIIGLVSTSPHLHSPMYFFLGHLATSDILVSACIVPSLLNVTRRDGLIISLGPCIFQMFLFCVSETVECFILAVMSYDRYLAIRHPLRYMSIMNTRLQHHLIFWSWLLGIISSIILASQISMLHYCEANIIDHFFCDTVALLELSCSNSFAIKIQDLIVSVTVTLFPFAFIFLTYVGIFVTILQSPTAKWRQKAFSTCTSHLLVVTVFFGSLLCVYGAPSSGYSANLNKSLSLIYTLITPLFNPIVYSLRSQEIRYAFRQQIRRFQVHRIFI
uniref:Olfactory receptor n=1 Tax=Pyxicephalus adspersus TaxID=30357 RepID=A0AAV3AZB9_PYXAD|nr:TPA: hypothetical protein GDO54_005764 [Pyxicephalus adspersus]